MTGKDDSCRKGKKRRRIGAEMSPYADFFILDDF
jgi:hypothetical protein